MNLSPALRDCMSLGCHEFQRRIEIIGVPESEAVYVWRLPRPSNVTGEPEKTRKRP